ncbi:glycosyl hydrolase 53 family protein [Limibacter armeniacum]|uniref:glycosyl hydrolase 53 family protein n=1 Tax=Limibacter armeniacum TaxID=466084 RepID=UPI002FE6B5A0
MKMNTYPKLLSLVIPIWLLSFGSLNAQTFYKGVDLSYVNEMEDCGAVFKENGQTKDPYQIFYDYGANLVRVRLWHNPTWTNYSNFADVKKSIQRAKSLNMEVLLDFHYSDEWTDPEKQYIPAAWEYTTTVDQLKQEVYNYTYNTLASLNSEGLMPELVQVGNETNGNVMVKDGVALYPVDFARSATLLNAGIQAVKDAGAQSSITPKTVIHIADPANAAWWFSEATAAGLTGYDIIGLSYYPVWHTSNNVSQTGDIIASLKTTYNKDVMIVETGHPWTNDAVDETATNVMEGSASGYAAPTPEVQKDFLVDLTTEVAESGGIGVIYWEPAWVSTPCSTLWGTGSHWENVTFFDFDNELMESGGIGFLSEDYISSSPTEVQVTFKVNMEGVSTSNGVYVTGDFTGDGSWSIVPMSWESGTVYSYTTTIAVGSTGGYYFLNANDWGSRETVPTECAAMYNSDRAYTIGTSDMTLAYKWGSCEEVIPSEVQVTFKVDMEGVSTSNGVYVTGDFTGDGNWSIVPMSWESGSIYTYTTNLAPGSSGGYYFLNANNWSNRETVPTACATIYNSDREYTIGNSDITYAFVWNSCDTANYRLVLASDLSDSFSSVSVYPNPASTYIQVKGSVTPQHLALYSVAGTLVMEVKDTKKMDISQLNNGLYMLVIDGSIKTRVIKK